MILRNFINNHLNIFVVNRMLQFHNSFLYEVNLINEEYVKNVVGKKPLLIFFIKQRCEILSEAYEVKG